MHHHLRMPGEIGILFPDTPQQENGSDCGVYAILAALDVATAYRNGCSVTESMSSLRSSLTAGRAAKNREYFTRKIEEMASSKFT